MCMPYVLFVLHAVSVINTGTVFPFQQTHRFNIGPVSTGYNTFSVPKLSLTQTQFFRFDHPIGLT